MAPLFASLLILIAGAIPQLQPGPSGLDTPAVRARTARVGVLTIVLEGKCSACRELSDLLEHDAETGAWLAERFEIVRLESPHDAERLRELDVVEHPTLLVATAGGAERDRLVGAKTASMLRVQLERVLALPAGELPVRERFSRRPHAHEERGNELWARGRPDEAAPCYLLALQDPVCCARADRVERARVLRRMYEAQRFSDGSTCSLQDWRDACLERRVEGSGPDAEVWDLLEATRLLNWGPDAFAVWERLASFGRLDSRARTALWPICCARLVELGRDGELLDAAQDPRAALNRLAPRVGEYLRAMGTPSLCGTARLMQRQRSLPELERLAPLYTAALRTGAMDWVRAIESELVPSLILDAYPVLVRAAVRAGDRDYARGLIEGARRMFPDGLLTKELSALDAELARR